MKKLVFPVAQSQELVIWGTWVPLEHNPSFILNYKLLDLKSN